MELSDEEYIIMRAKEDLNTDPYAAKAWMLTAKTLFPTNFNVQFEAYMMEKAAGRLQECADCFTALINAPQIPNQLWPEIDAITASLKGPENSFVALMFQKIAPEVQHKILLASAEHSEDTMEHCRLLLLLLKRFPSAVASHGGRLVETLLSAEKHSSENCYARLLVVETLPLLENPQSPRLLVRLLVRAIDFYNTYLYEGKENDIIEPWQKLFDVLELTGKQLGWDPYLITYPNSLSKDSYFQKLLPHRTDDDCRQAVYCGAVHLLRALHEHNANRGNMILLEAFSDPDLPLSKRRKGDIEITGAASNIFLVAANCWELLHSNEILKREFLKLTNQLQVKPWLGTFMEEMALFKGRFEEALPPPTDVKLAASLTRASVMYCQSQYASCLEHALVAFGQMPIVEGQLEPSLIVGGTHRHLHFLPLTKSAIVHYCAKLLLHSIKAVGSISDLAAGNMIVLLQLDWPQEEGLLLRLLDAIRQRGVFHYPLFQSYIINIDILEELMYLWSEQGGSIVLDILPNAQQHLGQRRIGTRGADKGVKEDIKQAMRAQVARCNEPIINLVTQFITQERNHLLQSFL